MNYSLLIVSANDNILTPISEGLQDYGFSCFYARGRLKVKELLQEQDVNAIVWFYHGYNESLAKELLGTFDIYLEIPIILITKDFADPDFMKESRNTLFQIDQNEDVRDILSEVERACNQSHEIQDEEDDLFAENLHEIDFKHAMNHIIVSSDENREQEEKSSASLKVLTPWIAVDSKEKQIIAGFGTAPERTSLLDRVRNVIGREFLVRHWKRVSDRFTNLKKRS